MAWPALPRIARPALPRITLPALPRIAWPALPRIAWPALPRIAWPALIAAGGAFLLVVANVVPNWVVPEKVFERSGVGGKAAMSAPAGKARVVLRPAPGTVAPGGRQDVNGIIADPQGGEGAATGQSLTAAGAPSEAAPGPQNPIVPETLATIKQLETVPPPQVARPPVVARAPVPQVQRPPSAPAIAQQKPSFSCGGERTWAEKTICTDAGLAALDRAASSLWGDAMDRANAAQRASLLATDRQFMAGRNRCSTDSCVRSAYLVNMSNIRTIMSGTPLPR